MRKLIKHTIYLFIFTFGFSSCVDFLDRVPDSVAYNDEEVFTDYTKSQEYINQLMTPFRYFDDNDIEGAYANTSYYGTHGKSCYGLRERITDNCIYNPKYSWVAINRYRNGDFWSDRSIYWSEGSEIRFETIWKAIRVANVSIANIDRLQNATEEQRNKILGMAYFLRGHFYFMLLQGWGGMPYITEPLDPEQNMDLPRDSYIVTAQKIAADFETSSTYLPLIVDETEWGLPSKMAAKAYKAKALLWAASPFANENNDQQLWEDAAIAAGEAIKMAEESNYYQLVSLENFKKLFVDCDEETLKEIIFGRLFKNTTGPGGSNAPHYCGIPSTEFGASVYGAESVTENLAQCFTWSNGEPIDPNTDEYKHHPYTGDGVNHTGRDPRFYQTILYNGASTPQVTAKNRTVEIWNKSYDGSVAKELVLQDGNAKEGYTITGYYNWKLYSDAYAKKSKTMVMWNYIRLADVYLYYAEAANRAWGPTGVPSKIEGFSMTAVDAINKVRTRAQMPSYSESSASEWLRPGSIEEFEQKIRNEYRVETAFEEKRFYDLRRWKMMLDTDVQTTYGMYIEKTGPDAYTYTVTPLGYSYNLKWLQHHYLFKIKTTDTSLGPNFQQNPGW